MISYEDFFHALCGTNTGMSDHYFKDQLYPLQDAVLGWMGSVETSFYLTGGTCLSRFLLHHRYSDDLDFFTNQHPLFLKEVDRLMDSITGKNLDINLVTKQDSFVRCVVTRGDVNLKVEFINDVKYRVGNPIKDSTGINLDTWQNILSNKITALGRQAPKDFVDILFLSFKFQFNWEKMIDHAKEKDASVNEIDVSKMLSDFDLSQLSNVIFPSDLSIGLITAENFKILARESLHGFDNSLYGLFNR